MKTYRFYYWFGSITTECYIKATNEQSAKEKFKELKGDRTVISIEEVKE